MGTEVKFPCVTCTKEVQIKDHAIQCELFCRSKGSITQKVHELETRILLMDHQHQITYNIRP